GRGGGVCRVARNGNVSSGEAAAGRGGQVCWPGGQVRLHVGIKTSVPMKGEGLSELSCQVRLMRIGLE
ncbi:MAG: hypothetical protein SGI72_15920, partial [Planctomycetota bacterium]|nr:hypothetical protein [Planctomycetota bacterium]